MHVSRQREKFRSRIRINLSNAFPDERKKLSLWGRQSSYLGGPSVVSVRKSAASRARSADARTSFGFGSGTSRFTVIQSQPASPMVEQMPLFWCVRDIDIGDKPKPSNEMFGHRPMRTRSRHDCHFTPGSSVPFGKMAQGCNSDQFFFS